MTKETPLPYISDTPKENYECLSIKSEESDLLFFMFPLSYFNISGRIGVFQNDTLKDFFEGIDKPFKDFLGINRANTDEDLEQEVARLLEKERDLQHKYYLVQTSLGDPVAIFYVYDYRQKWGKTKIGFGLLTNYRGKGLATLLLKPIIEKLENENGMCRIEGEVETTNNASLQLCQKLSRVLGFESEGIRRNNWGKGIDCQIFARCN